MKRILTIAMMATISLYAIAQKNPVDILIDLEFADTLEANTMDTLKLTPDTKQQASVVEGTEKTTSPDTTKIRFGKRNIVIVEKDGTTSIEIPELKESGENMEIREKSKPKKFKGHWAAVEWGFNGYMDSNHSINMKDDLRYLELKQGRSWNFNINFLQYSLGFNTDKAGLVTGLGFEFNNYHFRNPITLTAGTPVTGVDSTYILDPNMNVVKSKFSTTHLTVPLLFEFQIPTGHRKHRIFFSTGVIGGVKIGSSTKVQYEGTQKGKDKTRNDFNLSQFRYGLTARIGYGGFRVFANYYPTPLFEEGKGPELYSFTVGLILLKL